MSDVQILTGISILVSAYYQLSQRKINIYNWVVATDLAWFSTLTHLACLTALRKHLITRKAERVWRLIAMALILVALCAGVYAHQSQTPIYPGRPANCFFKWDNNDPWPDEIRKPLFDRLPTIASIIMLISGFVFRVVRLHKQLTADIIRKPRDSLSRWSQERLRQLFEKRVLGRSPTCLWRTLVYRPSLAMFLAVRIISDSLTSMFFEVRFEN